ncbi:MAG: alpha-L-fucosidase [Caldilineaceae bacterium]|nr:alpha-L-fucosidase [Caldilineaceae bacterium]
MPELTLDVPSTLVERIRRLAAEENETPEDMALMLLRRGYDFVVTVPEVQPDRSQRPGARNDPRLDWWREARFGLFIHWGLYSIPAGVWNGREWPGIAEWLMYRAEISVREYERLASQFNPARFDAREWVSLAKRAGQKYIVITSKHHDGFCLFESAVTEYDIVDATPFKRDVLKELAEECARRGSSWASTTRRHRTGITRTATATIGISIRRRKISRGISRRM